MDQQPPPDVLAGDPRHDRTLPTHVPTLGEVLELDGFVGAVTEVTHREVELLDRRGRRRRFGVAGRLAHVDDRAVTLAPPVPRRPQARTATTRSGSLAAPSAPAGVARASRIWVEGVHDAELLELVWGDDLRAERIVVEPLGGIDDLAGEVARFGPGPQRRLGVLVDHLVTGSKESRIAHGVQHEHVLVAGHPYVDVWAGIRPARAGLAAWPHVPRGTPWKDGIAAALGHDHPADAWRWLRSRVRDWHDLEQPLVRAVEELLDHVTA